MLLMVSKHLMKLGADVVRFHKHLLPILVRGGGCMLEKDFQRKLIKTIKERLPGCIVLKTDPTYIQGLPDLLILYRYKWAALEVKASLKARRRPNQKYYIDKMNKMAWAFFICPQNCKEGLDAVCRAVKA